MKKLIIALSAMAIASFNFITPVSAEYRRQEFEDSFDYVLEKFKQGIYIGDYEQFSFDTQQEFAKQVCIEGNFEKALDNFKKTKYNYYVALIILLNQDRYEIYAFKQNLITKMAKYCPQDKIIYPTVLKN
jgi:hypothetical protein